MVLGGQGESQLFNIKRVISADRNVGIIHPNDQLE